MYWDELFGEPDKADEEVANKLNLRNHILIKLWTLNKDTRRIAGFLFVNMSFMIVEIMWGYFTNSLGLISDAAHMCFDCTALFIGLLAAYIAK